VTGLGSQGWQWDVLALPLFKLCQVRAVGLQWLKSHTVSVGGRAALMH
jgi:hypothetical protein